jgi:hypothetical protein
MSLFLRLLLGHMIGDYALQPLSLVLMKRRGWEGILIHVGIVTVVTGILLWPVLGHWWYWLWLLFLFVGHLLIDRSRALLLKDLEATSLWYLIIDQALHLCLIALIAVLSHIWQTLHPGLPALTASPQENGLIAYLICLVFLIWTVPVLEVETVNTLMSNVGSLGKGTGVRIAGRDRLLGALERIGGAALMLAGFIYLVPLAFLPRVLLQREEWHNSPLQGRFLVKMAISFSLTILIGLVLARIPLRFL